MRNYGKPVAEEVVKEFLYLDMALYSLWMPGDETTAAIVGTRAEPPCSYDIIIEPDDVARACVTYLVHAGAPVFKSAASHARYMNALEHGLGRGLPPLEARQAALRATEVQGAVQAVAE